MLCILLQDFVNIHVVYFVADFCFGSPVEMPLDLQYENEILNQQLPADHHNKGMIYTRWTQQQINRIVVSNHHLMNASSLKDIFVFKLYQQYIDEHVDIRLTNIAYQHISLTSTILHCLLTNKY